MLHDHNIEKSHIPDRYNESKIILMVKDPYWLYTYWDINDHTQAMLLPYHGGRWALKVNNVTSQIQEKNYFYIPVDTPTGNWYIYANRPNSFFTAEIGWLMSDELFISLAQSNMVYTPRDREVGIYNPYYVNIFDMRRQYGIKQTGAPSLSRGSEAFFGISSQNMFNRT